MDWIFDHMQLVIAAAAAFAYWLNARREKQAEEQEAQKAQRRHDTDEAADEAERARRIREEIRRKIAERSGDVAPQAPRPVAGPPPVIRELEFDPPSFEPEPVRQPMIDTAVLEQQRRLQEQLEEVARTKRRAQEIRRAAPAHRSTVAAPVRSEAGRGLRADLQNRASLRRAVVLREVLGPPVGLR